MKEFDSEKFCQDLVSLKEKESQDVFAKRLDIKRPTLSLLENGSDFSMLKDVNEKRVCRFATEILFLKEALNHEIRDYCRGLLMIDF